MTAVRIGAVLLAMGASGPAFAQTMDHGAHDMTMPMHHAAQHDAQHGSHAVQHGGLEASPSTPQAGSSAGHAHAPALSPAGPGATMPDPHAGHEMHDMETVGSTTGMADLDGQDVPHERHGMSGHDMSGTALPAGDAPPPRPPLDHAADHVHDSAEMAMARTRMRREHGGSIFAQLLFDLGEYQFSKGRDSYRWQGEGWVGGDVNRLVVKSEGEGEAGGRLGTAEVQGLYSRAVDAYWNLQLGVRQDIRPREGRTHATIGVEGLAPYWFEIDGALFLSDRGDLTGRVEGYYDQRITQQLILQPRAEIDIAAQTIEDQRIGHGLSTVELGLRLRYEIRSDFAPYVGFSWERRVGETARLTRDADEKSTSGLVLGVRGWF